jgi:hypothetical protein
MVVDAGAVVAVNSLLSREFWRSMIICAGGLSLLGGLWRTFQINPAKWKKRSMLSTMAVRSIWM